MTALRTVLLVLMMGSVAAYGAVWYLSRPGPVELALQSQDKVAALLKVLGSSRWEERQLAVEALGNLPKESPGMDRAVMRLAELLGSEDLALQASTVSSLARLGAMSVPALNVALDDENPIVRRNAARSLEQMGSEGGGAVLALIYALGDPDVQVETAVSNALSRVGPPPPETAPVLALVLRHENYAVRSAAARALRSMGKDALEPLIDMLHDSDSNVRVVASLALCEIGRGAEDAAQSLILLLDSDNKVVRLAAARALEEISNGELVFQAYPKLREMLAHEDEDIRIAAIRTIGSAGKAAMEAIPELAGLLDGASREERQEIALALGSLGPDEAGIAVESLRALTRDTEPAVRTTAALALGHMGPAGASALESLVGLLKDQDVMVSITAARALGEMGQAAESATPALMKAVEAVDDVSRLGLRYEAIRSIGRIAPDNKDVHTFLDNLLDGQDGTARIIAACELTRGEADTARIVPVIIEGLTILDDAGLRARAAEALGRIGPAVLTAAPDAVKRLLELADESDDSLRMAAARALVSIDPNASARLPSDLRQRVSGS